MMKARSVTPTQKCFRNPTTNIKIEYQVISYLFNLREKFSARKNMSLGNRLSWNRDKR